MIVEDDRFFASSLAKGLSKAGFRPTKMRTMESAIATLEAGSHPMLVLASLQIPDIDACAACLALKQSETLQHIPVLLYGTETEEELTLLASQCYANGVLKRPFRAETVVNWIRENLFASSSSGAATGPQSVPQRVPTFPPPSPSQAPYNAEQSQAPSAGPAKILVVDDELLVRTLLRDLLEEENYLVEEASDWDSFRSQLMEHDFAVVLLDIGLPNLSGDKLALFVEQFVPPPRPRVVLHSGREERELKVIAEKVGAFSYLTKSAANAKVLAVIQSAVEAYKKRNLGFY